jgi:hypothetical protein
LLLNGQELAPHPAPWTFTPAKATTTFAVATGPGVRGDVLGRLGLNTIQVVVVDGASQSKAAARTFSLTIFRPTPRQPKIPDIPGRTPDRTPWKPR